ncbi:hypothetical protein FGO68_gene3374 [Halteria grandinella]|uniref:Uncharacterized protein n=1 Tax=Halteria grandinella TaxID=5974 RepID=A0A8J8NX81_HALGN|nr:hypothetical protein FGO68_gene3374 [Halteria grandinella]
MSAIKRTQSLQDNQGGSNKCRIQFCRQLAFSLSVGDIEIHVKTSKESISFILIYSHYNSLNIFPLISQISFIKLSQQ